MSCVAYRLERRKGKTQMDRYDAPRRSASAAILMAANNEVEIFFHMTICSLQLSNRDNSSKLKEFIISMGSSCIS